MRPDKRAVPRNAIVQSPAQQVRHLTLLPPVTIHRLIWLQINYISVNTAALSHLITIIAIASLLGSLANVQAFLVLFH